MKNPTLQILLIEALFNLNLSYSLPDPDEDDDDYDDNYDENERAAFVNKKEDYEDYEDAGNGTDKSIPRDNKSIEKAFGMDRDDEETGTGAFKIEQEDEEEVEIKYDNGTRNNEDNKAEDDKPFKINKKDYTKAEVIDWIKEDLGTDVTKLSADKAKSVIEKFVKMNNVDAGHRAVNRTAQENASIKKEIEQKQNELDDEWERFKADKLALEKRIAGYDEKIRETFDEDDKVSLIARKINAEEKLEDLKGEEKELQKIETDLKRDVYEAYVEELVFDLTDTFPEDFKTSRPLINVLKDINEGNLDPDDEDFYKAKRLNMVMEGYAKDYGKALKRPEITKYYNSFRKLYNPSASTPSPNGKNQTNEEKIRNAQNDKSKTNQKRRENEYPRNTTGKKGLLPNANSTMNKVDTQKTLADLNMG